MKAIYWRVYDTDGNLVLQTERTTTVDQVKRARTAILAVKRAGYRVTRVTVTAPQLASACEQHSGPMSFDEPNT